MHSVETQLHEQSVDRGSFSGIPSCASVTVYRGVSSAWCGQVEPNTDLEAELLRRSPPVDVCVGTRGVTAAGGYNRAFRRWHTTTETHGFEEFPLYQN